MGGGVLVRGAIWMWRDAIWAWMGAIVDRGPSFKIIKSTKMPLSDANMRILGGKRYLEGVWGGFGGRRGRVG